MAFSLSTLAGPDLVLELATFLDKSAGGEASVTKIKQEIPAGRLSSALSHIITQSAGLWTSATDKDLEAFYALLGHFLASPEYKLGNELRDSLVQLISSETSRAQTRLAVLNHLYNSGREGAWKIALFEAMVKLAIAAKQNTILDQILQDLDRLFQLWHVAEAEKSRIHYSLHNLLAESDPWLSHVHMLKWLESFKSESDAAQHVDQLTAAITSALARSTVFQYQSIASSHAAAAVAKKNADLIKLAQIFTSGSYNDLIAFSKASPAVFAAPLSLEAATTKIRILTIVSLANKNAIIPYETVAKEIGVSVDDAESWVLDTISEGLLEAKLDHLSSSVFVTYAFRREFGNAQWKDLQDKLSKWMDNIQGMISVIRDARSHGKEGQHTALKHGLVGSSQ